MNAKLVEEIANAVLYEGYMLYPYRPSSVKNRQRWNFGVVYPKAYSEMQSGSDNWFMQTECLATGDSSTRLTIKMRFLQAVARTIGELEFPLDEWPHATNSGPEPEFRLVESLRVGDQTLQSWQEAAEREIVVPSFRLADPDYWQCSSVHVFPGGGELEPVRSLDGPIAAVIVRTKEAVTAKVNLAVAQVDDGLFRLTVRLSNISPTAVPPSANREDALLHSLLSAHTILNIEGGEFVSSIDPPAALKDFAATCTNAGTWPVLAGEEGRHDCILSSPIILYDYPQIAPESPGNLFDGTEIDEILALRILTLTDGEKNEMRNADQRSRQILERTESMPAEHFMKLHGVLRGLRPAEEERS
jgi:hypothetical protein